MYFNFGFTFRHEDEEFVGRGESRQHGKHAYIKDYVTISYNHSLMRHCMVSK